jgi:VWFA-related protein
MMVRLSAIPAAILCAGMACLAQQQPEGLVIKTESAAVAVDVIVTDHKGHHVEGLSAGDFKLYEDNAPQSIASFLPPPARAESRRVEGRPVVTAPASSAARSEPEPPAQLITLVIDTGDLQFEHLKQACVAASKFAERTIAAGNSVAVYWVDTSLHLAVPFTQERQKVADVLERMGNRAPFGRLSAREGQITETGVADLLASIRPVPGPTPGDGKKAGRSTSEQVLQEELNREAMEEMKMAMSWQVIASSFQARAVFMALRALAVGYRSLPGRKSVVVFSGGFSHSKLAESEMQAVVDAANRANVAIYVIDASGLNSARRGGLMSADKQIPDITDGREAVQNIAKLRDKDSQSGGISRFEWAQTLGSDLRGDLGLVADKTGGFLVKDTNDFGPGLDRVEDDASEFYTLVYYPSNRNYDGAFRSIKVELAERGYHVRYRQGYWALPPGREVMITPAAAQLLAAVESGERKPAFAPQLNAAMVTTRDGHFAVSTAISMPGKVVRFDKGKDQYVAAVTVLLVARDAQGQLLSVHERYADVTLGHREREEFSAKTFNLQGHVPIPELEPVSVQAVVRFADGTVGVSERKQMDPVPGSANLRATSLVLSDHEEDSACSDDPMDPLCVKGVRLSLPAHPQFARSTKLWVFFSLLGVSLDEAHRPGLGVYFGLRSGDSLSRFAPAQVQASGSSVPHAYTVLAAFDLQALQPGKYTLEMTAEDKIQGARASERAEFAVE